MCGVAFNQRVICPQEARSKQLTVDRKPSVERHCLKCSVIAASWTRTAVIAGIRHMLNNYYLLSNVCCFPFYLLMFFALFHSYELGHTGHPGELYICGLLGFNSFSGGRWTFYLIKYANKTEQKKNIIIS